MKAVLVLALVCACRGSKAPTPPVVVGPTPHATMYEAESGTLGGAAAIAGAPDGSSRARGDVAGEASGRQAVTLTQAGDSVAFALAAADVGATAMIIRFSIPDAPGGGGASLPLHVSVAGVDHTLLPTSRYAWVYGGVADGTKLYDVPANATTYATAANPIHIYDEIQFVFPALASNEVVSISKQADSGAAPIAIDFIELETIAAALSQPANFISLTDPQCGAIAADVNHTGAVFDGSDDSSYGSVFNAVIGTNPVNPVSFLTQEKVYYSNAPGDALQDNAPNTDAQGMTLFALADHNLQSVRTCVALQASGGYAGVWIPPGRYFVRGVITLPSNAVISGAGMWQTKIVAVDDEPPMPSTVNGVSGISSVSGDLVFHSASPTSDSVQLSNFSMFGNVTQRDTIDAVGPLALRGAFTHSTFDHLWVEHYFIGLNVNGPSSQVTFSNCRARNTFADGIDFYGNTSSSMVTNSESRSTGDDGFAQWAQASDIADLSRDNQVTNSVARLQWYGNGFSIYGGVGIALSNSQAFDILNYPGVQISTQFVPAALPANAMMTASATQLELTRCGGDGFNQSFGALLIGTTSETISQVTVSHVLITDPANSGIDLRPTNVDAAHYGPTLNVGLSDVTIVDAPACLLAKSGVAGAVALANICVCAATTSTGASCTATNASAATLTSDSMCTNACDAAP